jgi:type IV pilus assembly protein PilY1
LWHATVNSRGNFFNVDNAQQLAAALTSALLDISSRSASASGAALANANLSSGSDNIVYVPSYTSGEWTGELEARPVDPKTGLVIINPVTSEPTSLWKHSEKLEAQAIGSGWDSQRKLLTRSGTAFVPFRLGSLNATQKTALGATTAVQQAVLDYLRGDRTNENQSATGSLQFRPRPKLLGDITLSEPRAVAGAIESYSEAYNPGYVAFRAQIATRTPMVYFGANDGFFHAVNGEKNSANAGKEVFAYMPGQLLRAGDTGIAALTYKPTDAPPRKFNHRFYVDGTPFSRDVDFSRTSQSGTNPTPTPAAGVNPDWRTVLITGLGKGGSSYVAFDITTPATGNETEADLISANKVLWEFTEADMGFTYGKPAIVKTSRYGWVALLAGGYNNVSGPNPGKGIVYVVDVKTGTMLHKFITPDGSASDPLGLAYLDAFIPDVTDYTASEIYAGDLFGNLWRFDLVATGAYPAGPTRFAQLRDTADKPQPITTYPLPYADPLSGRRFVAVGTGKLFDATDLATVPTPQRQTLYNIADGSVYEANKSGLPIVRAKLTSVDRAADVPTTAPTTDGWYQDLLPNFGERIIKEVTAAFGVVVATTITPSTDPCNRGGIGTAYARSGETGVNQITGSTFLGGTANSPLFAGVRLVKKDGGELVIQVLQGNGTISTLEGIKFPGGFQGTVINYREVIE